MHWGPGFPLGMANSSSTPQGVGAAVTRARVPGGVVTVFPTVMVGMRQQGGQQEPPLK